MRYSVPGPGKKTVLIPGTRYLVKNGTRYIPNTCIVTYFPYMYLAGLKSIFLFVRCIQLVQVALVSLSALLVLQCSVYERCPLSGLIDVPESTEVLGTTEPAWNGLMKKLRDCTDGKSSQH